MTKTSWVPFAAVTALALAVWEIWARRSPGRLTLFPAPSRIAAATLRLAEHGSLGGDVASTVVRVLAGLLLAALPALAIGVVAGWNEAVGRTIDPILSAGYAIPKIAILPLFLAVFGIGESSVVLIIAASAFFPLAISAMAGVAQISPVHFEIARHYGATRRRTFTAVVWPGSLPTILVGARIAATVALLVGIAVELLVTSDGVGALIWRSWQTLAIESLYAGLFIASVLGILIQSALGLAARRLLRWQPSRET